MENLCLLCGGVCSCEPERKEIISSTGVHFSSAHDNWSTPQDLYESLNKEFEFDYDPCPLNPNPQVDGLLAEWGRCSFVNPPYSSLGEWVKKSYLESKKGKTVVMLIPSRTDTVAWHDYVMRSSEIRFIRGRLKFGGSSNYAPFPSAVVVFRGTHEQDD